MSRVRKSLLRFEMIAAGDRVLCAVSGGADSLALADVLLLLRRELDFELALAHVDHAMREGSGEDAARVASFAKGRDVPFLCRVVRVAVRGSREAAARDARHEALAAMADEWRATRIALGHTASDRAETLLLFLARGAGRRGLASMEPVREGRIIRPLCEVTREEARAYAEALGLPFADDPTNADLTLARNRVRAEILPALRRLNPRADQGLAAAAQDLAVEEALLSRAASDERTRLFRRVDDVHVAEASALEGLPSPLRARVLLQELAAVRGSDRGLGRPHLAALERLLRPGAREAHLPGARAWRDGGFVCLGRTRPERPPAPEPVAVTGPGVFAPREGIQFQVRLLHCHGAFRPATEGACFDADRIGFPLWIRGPRAGDWMRIESGGRRKVSDELGEARVPSGLRAGWLVVSDAEEVLWIPGVRQSARGRASEGTRHVLSIEAHGLMFRDPYANQVEGRGIFAQGSTRRPPRRERKGRP